MCYHDSNYDLLPEARGPNPLTACLHAEHVYPKFQLAMDRQIKALGSDADINGGWTDARKPVLLYNPGLELSV